jgi:NAD(P)-dependent dehydrogenase (short-subunit alcohol dehydrogenase family)
MYKVLVTGGTKGIGAAIAQRLKDFDFDVLTCARDKDASIQCDVTNASEVEAMRNKIGPIDVLVNNVGGVTSGLFRKIDEATWDHHFAVNVKSTFLCTQAFLPSMLSNKFGRIINIASTAGLNGYRYVSAYVAAKHAVIGFTRSLALEVAEEGVTVNAVCPSFVDTPMLRESSKIISEKTGKSVDSLIDEYRLRSPQKRLVTPEEVAAAVQFLIETPAVNGQAIALNGGE